MVLTRRANAQPAADSAQGRDRSGSTIWEDEANQYWQAMEPTAKQRRGRSALLRVLLLLVVLCGAGGLAARFGGGADAWLQWSASLSPRFLLPTVSTTGVETTGTNATDAAIPPVQSADPNPTTTMDRAGLEQLRARCRVRGVQTRWHEETCRKMCQRDQHQSACMNGCSYGSITVTKLTCDALSGSDAQLAVPSRCPDAVGCAGACRAYDSEKPFPAMRNACERGCANVVPGACARVLQIFRDLASHQ